MGHKWEVGVLGVHAILEAAGAGIGVLQGRGQCGLGLETTAQNPSGFSSASLSMLPVGSGQGQKAGHLGLRLRIASVCRPRFEEAGLPLSQHTSCS